RHHGHAARIRDSGAKRNAGDRTPSTRGNTVACNAGPPRRRPGWLDDGGKPWRVTDDAERASAETTLIKSSEIAPSSSIAPGLHVENTFVPILHPVFDNGPNLGITTFPLNNHPVAQIRQIGNTDLA